ncbi:DUF6112 family protein [Kitasatospora sp. NPDC001527]|uniref:DUF6112 family protein n=1 Tax=Kitasatospora sp. NPDC001527 TaxID=3154519 RepID=UPI003317C4C5
MSFTLDLLSHAHTLAAGADPGHLILAGPTPTPKPGGGVVPNIAPDANAPGGNAFTTIVGALMFYGLLAGLAGLVLGAMSFSLGKYFSHHGATTGGRVGMLAALACVVVIGGGSALVNWAFNLGASIT